MITNSESMGLFFRESGSDRPKYTYTHKDASNYLKEDGNAVFFLVGHAYNPFDMLEDESAILDKLSEAFSNSVSDYWRALSDCFLQVYNPESCIQKWRKLHLRFGDAIFSIKLCIFR